MSSATENSELEIQNSELTEPEETEKAEYKTQSEENSEESTSTTSHLTSSVPKAASTPRGAMTRAQLKEARELFPDLTDGEIFRLYKKVTN